MDKRKHIKFCLVLWQHLLGLEAWEIRWQGVATLSGNPSHPPYGDAECFPNFDDKRAFIKFNLAQMTTQRKIEQTVIHELLHLLQEEETEETHQMIRRLEAYIRRIRLRLQK